MKMNKWVVLTALISLPSISTAQIGGSYYPSEGSHEFTLSGSGAADQNFDKGTMGLSLSYGMYTTPNWLVSIRQGINYANLTNDNIWNGSTRLVADYHWSWGDRLRPVFGILVGGVYGDGISESGVAGLEVGLKYYVKPETFVYWQEEYQFFFKSSEDVNDNFDDGSFVHTLGVGYNF